MSGRRRASVLRGEPAPKQKFFFASGDLPDYLDDRARFTLWRDLYTAHYGALEILRPVDRPVSVRCKFQRWGTVGVGQLTGTVNRVARPAE
jgi:hypothetical protein